MFGFGKKEEYRVIAIDTTDSNPENWTHWESAKHNWEDSQRIEGILHNGGFTTSYQVEEEPRRKLFGLF